MKSCDLNSNDDDDSSAPPAIFALQEVCYPFASELHTFFANRGYHFVTGLYGRPFNGYVRNIYLSFVMNRFVFCYANSYTCFCYTICFLLQLYGCCNRLPTGIF